MGAFEPPVDVVDDAIEPRMVGWTQDQLSLDLAAGSGLVRLAKLGLVLHQQMSYFLDGNFILIVHLPDFVELDAHVNLGEFSIRFVVKVAQLHPSAD